MKSAVEFGAQARLVEGRFTRSIVNTQTGVRSFQVDLLDELWPLVVNDGALESAPNICAETFEPCGWFPVRRRVGDHIGIDLGQPASPTLDLG